MHNLEKQITAWRASMRQNTAAEIVEELEGHLRESIERLTRTGLAEDEAFATAVRQLGSGGDIAAEFAKKEGESWWAVKAALIAGGVAGLPMLFLLPGLIEKPLGWLLVTHVIAITCGYLATFLTGALGICFVAQRCLTGFSPGRLQSAARTTSRFAMAALPMTVLGVGLGMIWAKLSWGRYWAWDAKETGGFCVLLWLALFILGARFRLASSRAVMLLSIVGNLVVTFGWFAPNLTGLHDYRLNPAVTLMSLSIVHAVFLALGFAPSRCFGNLLDRDRRHG